jgi:hypothetical protein
MYIQELWRYPVKSLAGADSTGFSGKISTYQNMAFTHTYKGVGECHPYREFEGMQPSR